jgi:hypothetical protein
MDMRKIILVTISFLLLACSTLSLKDLSVTPDTTIDSIKPTPNETLVSLYIKATVLAAQNVPQKPILTVTPGCAELPCPTCAAAESISPILPAPPTVSVPDGGVGGEGISKSIPISTSTPTAIPMPYQVQANTPIYLTNFAHQDKACNWSGVAGQVFDLSGNPVDNIVVIVGGKYNGTTINAIGMTGMTHLYGPGGYEIVLGDKPAASTAELTLTIFGLNGTALSDPILINTIGDCQKNLTLINFLQVR